MSQTSDAHSDTIAALALCVAANAPVALWGPPGQGKTSVMKQIADAYGIHMETVIASIREPSDFAGLPIVDSVSSTVTLAPPKWARSVSDADQGLVFFDEISTAPPAVQAALLRVVLDRVVGDLEMPSEVRIVAAANPPDMAADGWDLAPPMANRFVHLTWRLDASVVREGFSIGWPEVNIPVIEDDDRLDALLRRSYTMVGSFIGVRSELLTQIPTDSSAAGMAFPTPRSWETVARLNAYCDAVGANASVRSLLLIGTVGTGAATEFLTYLDNIDLPDPEDLLKDPEAFIVPSDRPDKVYAIAAMVHAAVVSKSTKERWEAAGDIYASIAEAGHPDIAYVTARKWAVNRPQGASVTEKCVRALAPVLTELGQFGAKG